jgi:hypothetical protein
MVQPQTAIISQILTLVKKNKPIRHSYPYHCHISHWRMHSIRAEHLATMMEACGRRLNTPWFQSLHPSRTSAPMPGEPRETEPLLQQKAGDDTHNLVDQTDKLHRALSARQVTLIALGGAIGTSVRFRSIRMTSTHLCLVFSFVADCFWEREDPWLLEVLERCLFATPSLASLCE